MTSWLDALENPLAIREVYGHVLPTLDGIELNTIALDKMGPTLRLNCDLVEFPDNPPADWTDGSNIAVLQIALTPVSTLIFDGADFSEIVTIALERSATGVRLMINGESLRIEAHAATATVRSLVGRRDGRRLRPS